jgi:hypothetical protein
MSMRSALAGGVMTVALAAALGSPAAQDAAAEDGASVLVRTVTGVPSWDVPADAGGDIVGGIVLRLAVLVGVTMALCAVAGRARRRGPALLAAWGGLGVAAALAATAAYVYSVTVVLPGGFGDLRQDAIVAAANDGAAFGLWTGWLVGLAVAVVTRPERTDPFEELATEPAPRGRITDPPAPWWAPTAGVDEDGRATTRPGPTVFPPGGMPPVVTGVPADPDPTPVPVPDRGAVPVPDREPDPDPDATSVLPEATDATSVMPEASDPTTPFPR